MFQLLEHEADLASGPPLRLRPGELLAIGDVDYGPSAAGHVAVVRSSHGDSVSASFERLPASGAEIEAVGREWRSFGGHLEALSGPGATVAAFRERAPGATVLHIASHTWALGGATKISLDPGPFRRVGIAFAAANLADTSESGVMTAAEIGTLDLRHVDMVVLSSCRSALGRPLSDEGLLGLRSAFTSAGARVVIASLWNVSDESTAFWMQSLYGALRKHDGDVLLAARDAARATRDWSRARGGSTSPYAWGAFTVSGTP
jgi:CHAT domain-containing protein